MRLDKFLKVSRLIKRRTLAKEICEQQRVEINNKTAKASSLVAVGDEITLHFGHKKVTVRVDKLLENVRKEEAGSLFTVIKEESVTKS